MEEAIKTIKELGVKMNAQDNRSTQLPLYVVQEKVKVYGSSDWCNERELKEDYDKSLVCEKCQEAMDKHDGESEPDPDCWDCDSDIWVHFNWEWEFKLTHGVFLLGEECDKYIERRRYEFGKEVRSYGISSYWSSDMASLLQAVSSLGSEDGKHKDFYRA